MLSAEMWRRRVHAANARGRGTALTCGGGVRQAVAIGMGRLSKHYRQAAGSYVDGWVSYQEPLRGVGKVGSDVDGWFFGSVTVEADVICYVRFTKYVYLRSLRVRIVVSRAVSDGMARFLPC